jgi:hypothetical protein
VNSNHFLKFNNIHISCNIHVFVNNPYTVCTGPKCCRRLKFPEFQDNRHMKVARLSAPHNDSFHPSGDTAGIPFFVIMRPEGLR